MFDKGLFRRQGSHVGGATHLSYVSARNVIIYLLLLLEWSTTYIYALLEWGTTYIYVLMEWSIII